MAKPPPLRISTDENVGELWTLADECRAWARTTQHDESDCTQEFTRLADKLDAIAKRLAAKESP